LGIGQRAKQKPADLSAGEWSKECKTKAPCSCSGCPQSLNACLFVQAAVQVSILTFVLSLNCAFSSKDAIDLQQRPCAGFSPVFPLPALYISTFIQFYICNTITGVSESQLKTLVESNKS